MGLYFLSGIFYFNVTAQDIIESGDTVTKDKFRHLQEVQVAIYGQGRPLGETPAAVGLVTQESLDRYGNGGLLPAVNSVPGVRMEERSPGSYRFSIRGSSLRAPFGVRNVKIYYNDIPVTDPGGFTYLNQFGTSVINEIQILKGPGSSLYGAGNGGVLLINSMPQKYESGIKAGTTTGSYNMNRTFVTLKKEDSATRHVLYYEHLNSDGYRAHAAMKKEMIAYDGRFNVGYKTMIGIHVLYNSLNYKTPGALTLKEYDKDARIARPAAGTVPGSELQDAGILQRNLLLGFSLKKKFREHWQNTTTIYGLYGQLENPAIRNYSKTIDPHFGGRTIFNYQYQSRCSKLQLSFGAEGQRSFATVGTYRNNKGAPDTLQTNDEVQTANTLGFVQVNWQTQRWVFESGVGTSAYNVSVKRVFPKLYRMKTAFVPVSPRIAVLYKIKNDGCIYVNISRGYAAPTTAELAPSGSFINPDLVAEYGWNYEAGTKGCFFSGKVNYDVTLFYYRLNHAIVLRKDSAGGDQYTNSGSTAQPGVEAKVDYTVADKPSSFLSLLKIWSAYTAYYFRYKNFIQLNDNFSGNKLPGVPAYTVTAGIDVQLKNTLILNGTYYFSDRIALNDANTSFAQPYHLLGVKCTYKIQIVKVSSELFVGADNILNQKYSLGNDINAAGGRYYNVAMPLNFYAGLVLHWLR